MAPPLPPQVEVMDEADFDMGSDVCGVLVQYPATDGAIHDYKARCPAGSWGWQQRMGARVPAASCQSCASPGPLPRRPGGTS